MGHGAWSSDAYKSYSLNARSMSRDALYSRSSHTDRTKSGQEVNVDKIEFRESRDSDEHPTSTPLMVALDVTGSMGIIPEKLTKEGLGILVNEILQKKPITDPHILFMGIGDSYYDKAPLQVTQFESDNRICDQLTDIWLEGCGGGNNFENYDLAWAFGLYKTRTDAWDKRKEKGFIFTIGDECFPSSIIPTYFSRAFGDITYISSKDLLKNVQSQWNIFHITIAQGNYARGNMNEVKESWSILGKRHLVLENYDYLPQLIVSSIALDKGIELEEVLGWWKQDCVGVLEKIFNS